MFTLFNHVIIRYVINNWNHFVQDKLQGGAAYKIKKW